MVQRDTTTGARLDRVESEVSSIRDDVAGLKTDVRSFGAVLTRIEDGILRSQDREDNRADRSRPNIIAIISVLITVVLTMVTGSYIVGDRMARLDERTIGRGRELDLIHTQIDAIEHRAWEGRASAVTTK